jgi:hypothetical protein
MINQFMIFLTFTLLLFISNDRVNLQKTEKEKVLEKHYILNGFVWKKTSEKRYLHTKTDSSRQILEERFEKNNWLPNTNIVEIFDERGNIVKEIKEYCDAPGKKSKITNRIFDENDSLVHEHSIEVRNNININKTLFVYSFDKYGRQIIRMFIDVYENKLRFVTKFHTSFYDSVKEVSYLFSDTTKIKALLINYPGIMDEIYSPQIVNNFHINNTLKERFKFIQQLDEQGNVLEYKFKDKEKIIRYTNNVYTYNEDKRIIEISREEIYNKAKYTNRRRSQSKIQYKYDAKGNRIEEKYMHFKEDSTRQYGRATLKKFDASRNLQEKIKQGYRMGKWVNDKKYVMKYDSDGNLLKITTKHWFKWKFFPALWLPIMKDTFVYKRIQTDT